MLAKYPRADLRVYTVWMPMLGGDARDAWDSGLLHDPRVRHYWDSEDQVGLALAADAVGGLGGGVVWDAYYVFGRNATWVTAPAPVVSAGSNVIDDTDGFERGLRRVLGQPS
jgi:hypothetical protein